MIVHRGLPSTLSAGGVKVTVRTGAALWVWLSSRMAEVDEKRATDILAQGIGKLAREGREIPLYALSSDEAKAVFKALVWFMRGGEVESQPLSKPAKERLLDYEKDFDAIYAAFLHSYDVDLMEEPNGKPLVQTMHWWRFMALVNNLPAGSTLVDYYMHYRGVDVSKLPRKTEADKKYVRQVIEIKKQVALDGKRAVKTAPKEPAFAKRARELRKGKENVARNDVHDKDQA